MRILIVVPRQPQGTGNWVTAERFVAGLVAIGHQVQVTETPVDSATTLLTAVKVFAPDAVLLLHAYRSGNPWLLSGLDLPCLVLPTGTDLHHDCDDPVRRGVIEQLFTHARAILLQNHDDYQTLQRQPELAAKLFHLPAAASLGDRPFNLERGEAPVLLHPSGIRPVKGNLELLQLCDRLAERQRFQLLFCGPELDPDYADRFREALSSRSWAKYLGTVPQAAMASLLRQCDLVLNNSISEGLSNALVEACSLGRPILARDNSGNRLVVEPGRNGLLYHSGQEFLNQADSLVSEPHRLAELTDRCRDKFSSDTEAKVLNQILQAVV